MRGTSANRLLQAVLAARGEGPAADTSEAEMFQQEFQRFKEQLRQEGRGQERRRLVRHLLEKKFGALDDKDSGRFEAADDDTVEQYADRMLIADTLAAVFAD